MDLIPFHMFRIVTENCYSESICPSPTQHDRLGLMWKKGEIIQLTDFPGGDLYIARSMDFPHDQNNRHHIFKMSFRELTAEERQKAGLPARAGDPINQEQLSQ